ncbi:MAG: serine hydrolase domain-containing protein [Leptospirales bacterium]
MKQNGIFLIIIFLCMGTGLFAQKKQSIETIHYTDGIPGKSDVVEYFDSYFKKFLNIYEVPGGTVTVVQGSQVLLNKGYGMAHVLKSQKFNPESTVLTVSSVSELFTSIATLQLYENGFIDLDADVSTYLKSITLPDNFGPLSVRNLLMHTDGFEAQIIGGNATNPQDLRPLKDELSLYITKRVTQPGSMITYGNIASNILGVLIEDVSGMSFAEYTEKKIFIPLGMNNSTFEQILPPKMYARTAIGYTNPGHQPYPYLYVNLAPMGGLRTTATDMSRIMIALQNGGVWGKTRILQPDTVKLILEENFRMHPDLPGVTHGFFEMEINGKRVLYKDGDGLGFRNRLLFLPAENISMFIHFNSDNGEKIRDKLTNAFIRRYFYRASVDATFEDSHDQDLEKYAGVYRPVQADETTFFKITLLFSNYVKVSPENGGLRMETPSLGEGYGAFIDKSVWQKAGDSLFVEVVRNKVTSHSIYIKDDLMSSRGYHGVYRKLSFWEEPDLHFTLVTYSMIVFHLAFFFWPLATWFFRKRKPDFKPLPTKLNVAAFTISAIYPILFIFLFIVLKGFQQLLYGVPIGFTVLISAYNTAFIVALYFLFQLVKNWKTLKVTLFDRLFLVALTFAILAFNWFLFYWNLLGFSY